MDNHKKLGRRQVLRMAGLGGAGLVLAPAWLTACSDSATTTATDGSSATDGAGRSLNAQLGWLANVENAGEYVAAESGFYADEGLDVTLTPGGPGAILEPTVVSGTALIGLSSADTIAAANAEGAGLRIVGSTLQRNPSAVMSLADAPIATPQELEGKKLGLQQSGDAIYDAFFAKAGVDASKVTRVPVQFDPAPLVAGEVDAFAAFETNQPIALRTQGIETVTFLLADYGYNLFADAFFVTEDTLGDEASRDTVVRWLRATRKGWQEALSDPAAAAALIVEGPGSDLGLEVDAQTETLEAFAPLIDTPEIADFGLFWMTDDDIATNVETMVSVGIDVDESLFTNELLEEV